MPSVPANGVMSVRPAELVDPLSVCSVHCGSGGYRITVDEPSLDLLAFRGLVRDAEHAPAPESELGLLRRALAYWEGDPLANLASPVLRSGIVASLVEERIRIMARCGRRRGP